MWCPTIRLWVADAIDREVSRSGQVYYVYNRVEGIYSVANGWQDVFPTFALALVMAR